MSKIPYTFTIGIIESLQLNNVGVADNAHDLELTVLDWRKQLVNGPDKLGWCLVP